MKSENQKFNHEAEDLLEAIGLSEERVLEIQTIMNELRAETFDGKIRKSEMIEKFTEKFTPVELTWVMLNLGTQLDHALNEIDSMQGSKKTVTGIIMGQKGEA